MAVPESVRQVPRPKNTVVVDSGKDTPKRYAVRERSQVIYVPGGNPQPHNGRVVGHIINGRFVPAAERASDKLEALSYGASALARSVSGDLHEDLLKVYDCKEAATIMALASLKVVRPGTPCSRMSTSYGLSFERLYYPGAALSKNSIGDLLQRLGKDAAKREAFYGLRLDRVMDEHRIAIDGMLKQDTSTVNDLSAYSYKARLKQHKEISLLYAYDIDLMEPICAEVFPGNQIDASSCPAFIRDNNITRGIIVNDRGFPPSSIRSLLDERPDLHFLTPIKRNDKRIASNGMLKFTGTFDAGDGKVLFKKARIRGGRWLYSFKSEEKASSEQHACFGRAHRKGLDPEKISEKVLLFGVAVFESDLDIDPRVIYRAYAERWLLELVFKRYKSDERLDRTCVQGDFSVIGSEFVNFIATTVTCRLLAKAGTAGLLDDLSLEDLLDQLRSAWRKTEAPLDVLPKRGDPYWVHTLQKVFDALEALGLLEPSAKVPRKAGRARTGRKTGGATATEGAKGARAVRSAHGTKAARNAGDRQA